MTVYLVRHASAGIREHWSGPDELRPLSSSGRRQAQGLVGLLAGARVTRIISSPAVRCVQTVEPLAASRGLRVETDERLLEGARIADAMQLIVSAGAAVLCTHGDIVEGVVLELARSGFPLTGGRRWAKGSTWELEVEAGRIVAGRYHPAPGD